VFDLKVKEETKSRTGRKRRSAAGECFEHSLDGGEKEGAVYARVLRVVENNVAAHSGRFRR
jgi:hypothetical protein